MVHTSEMVPWFEDVRQSADRLSTNASCVQPFLNVVKQSIEICRVLIVEGLYHFKESVINHQYMLLFGPFYPIGGWAYCPPL